MDINKKIQISKDMIEGFENFRVIQLYEFAISNEKQLTPYIDRTKEFYPQFDAYKRVIKHYGFLMSVNIEDSNIVVKKLNLKNNSTPISLAKRIFMKYRYKDPYYIWDFIVNRRVEFKRIYTFNSVHAACSKEVTLNRVIKNHFVEDYVMIERNKKQIYLIRKADKNELLEN